MWEYEQKSNSRPGTSLLARTGILRPSNNIPTRRLVAPPMTEPAIGGIENGIGGETDKQHYQTIDVMGGHVNRET